MKKILFVAALGASACMQAASTPKELNFSLPGAGQGAFAYVLTSGFLNHLGLRAAIKEKVNAKVANPYARFVAAQLSLAGADTATEITCELLNNKQNVYTTQLVGKRYVAKATVNTALSAAEELAKKYGCTAVESEVYTSVVRPVAQFFGTGFVLSCMG